MPVGGNLTAQLTGSHLEIEGKIQIPETLLQADCIFTKRQNLRFTGEEEEDASLVNMTDSWSFQPVLSPFLPGIVR